MKIAMFTDTFLPQTNGVVTAINNTLEALCKVHNIWLFIPGKKSFKIEKKSKNLFIVKIPSYQFYQYKGYRIPTFQLKQISRIIQKEKFDIIHIHTPFTLGLVGIAMSRLYSIPIVGTYHTYLPEYFPHITKGRFYRVMRRIGDLPTKNFTKYIYSKLDYVIAPSHETGRILKTLGIKNVTVIPNGIKVENLKLKNNFIENIKKKYKIPKQRKILLYLGRISFEKKLSILLQASKILENEDEKLFLLIVGSGPSIKKYKNEAKKLKIKNIRFTGFVKNGLIPDIYKASDIFVSPSDTEVCPMTFIEAMACGLPLIGVNSGGVKDIIQNRKNGLLAKANDPVSLAFKIKTLIDNEKLLKKMSIMNRNLYFKEYSIKNTTKKLMNLYKKTKKTNKKLHPIFKMLNFFLYPELTKNKIYKKFNNFV